MGRRTSTGHLAHKPGTSFSRPGRLGGGSSSSGSSGGTSSGSGNYYDKNKDYSLAIKQAQQNGASQDYISQLQQERQNKIDSQYGGKDPYRGSSNIMGNQGSSGGDIWHSINTTPPAYSGGSTRPSSGITSIGTPPLPSNNYGQNYNPSFSNPTPVPKPKLTMNDYMNKSGGDLSLAYRYADEDGADPMVLSQIQAARAAKIQAVYGGKDPYKGSYNIMGAPGKVNDTGDYTVGSIFGKPAPSYGGVQNPVKDTVIKGGPQFANKRIRFGEWTYAFNERGNPTGRRRDNGASANAVMPVDPNLINLSEEHRRAYEAAARGDSDEVGYWINKISDKGPINAHGDRDTTDATNYLHHLELAFGPGFQNFYRGKYDSVYGPGAWDAPNFYGRGQVNPEYVSMAQGNRENGVIGPQAPIGSLSPIEKLPFAPSKDNFTGGGFIDGGSGGGSPSFGGGGGYGGSFEGSFGGGGFDFDPGSGADYIRRMYAQQQAEAEAKLKAAYEAQLSKLRGQDDLIDTEYADRANQAAAQNELQRMQMAEMGIAQGLNTGATGQLALGQSMALQGALGGLDQAAAQDRMANRRAIDELNAMYEQKMAEIAAGIQADMTNALLDDYNRQQALYLEQQRQAQEDAWRQQQWEYQVGQDALDRQYKDAQLAQAQREFEAKQALNEAKFYGNPTNAVSGGSSGGGSNTKPTYKSTVNNMGLTNKQIRQLQGLKPGLTVDGLWGPASSAAFGDMDAKTAWDAYGGQIGGTPVNAPTWKVQTAAQLLGRPGTLTSFLTDAGRSDMEKINAIEQAVKSKEISEAVGETFLKQLGLV